MSGSSGKTILANIPAREWRGLTPEWAGGRLKIPLKCGNCGQEDHWSATRVISPERAIPKIIQLGWQIGGSLLCPICVLAHRHKAANKPQLTIVEQPVTNNIAKLETPKLLDDQKKNKRLVILALEDYFDEVAKRYRDGKSDRSISEELSLSVGFVANTREEFYGKLAEPEEVAQFRTELDGIQKGLDGLKVKFESMCTRNGWRI